MSIMNSQFEAEVLPHLPTLQKTAHWLKGNHMDAEDLVQETLYRALCYWNRFTPGTNCRAWLFRILNNQHINQWRAISREVVLVDIDHLNETDLAHLAQLPNRILSPEQEMISNTLDDDLSSALNQLKEGFRRPIFMYYFGDLPYSQIAHLTNLNLGTVKSRLFRGKKLLRKELSKYAI